MKQNLDCEMVRDLLPLYVDGLTSKTSNQAVREHLEGCAECKEALEQMKQKLEVDTAPEVTDFKKYLRRPGKKIFCMIMLILAGAAALSCFIVDLAVTGRLTWSLIVDGGILCAYLPGAVWMSSKKHRFRNASVVLNLCIFLLLALIQAVLYGIMGVEELWFFRFALPITLVWTVIFWFTVIVSRLLKWNLWIAMALFCFLTIFGSGVTNLLADPQASPVKLAWEFAGNGLGSLLTAIMFLVIGIFRRGKKV